MMTTGSTSKIKVNDGNRVFDEKINPPAIKNRAAHNNSERQAITSPSSTKTIGKRKTRPNTQQMAARKANVRKRS